MATLNTGILSVPFLFYEVSFICIHNIINKYFYQYRLFYFLLFLNLIRFATAIQNQAQAKISFINSPPIKYASKKHIAAIKEHIPETL